jgi:hypothetical protein
MEKPEQMLCFSQMWNPDVLWPGFELEIASHASCCFWVVFLPYPSSEKKKSRGI